MKNKIKRFATIKEIIATSIVGSQEELLQRLAERGFTLTQATLSRDLKQMKVAKTPDVSGQYIYRLPAELGPSVDFSGNNMVIHTKSGYASSLAYEIDERVPKIIIGTVAGEDTVIGVIKEGYSHEEVYNALSEFIPTIRRAGEAR